MTAPDPCPRCVGACEAVRGPVPGRWGVRCRDCDLWADDRKETEAEAIAAWNRRAVSVRVKPLVWENFDAWTFWARCPVGSYQVEERNGVWKATLDNTRGLEVVYEYTTDGLTSDDFQGAKAAAQADYEARILAALEPHVNEMPKGKHDTDNVLTTRDFVIASLAREIGEIGRDLGWHRVYDRADAIIAALEPDAALTAERDEARSLAAQLQSECEELHSDAAALRAKVARLEGALALYSCEDGCNDCPQNERDRVSCGWTARAALTNGAADE